MPYYDNWNDLIAAAQKKCAKILVTDVAPVAEEIVRRHIETDIYAAYTPRPGAWVNKTTYQRRKRLPEEVTHFVQEKGTSILVTSTAKSSKSIVKGWSFHNRRPGSFLSLIEHGPFGIWRSGFPRPAISKAQQEINSGEGIRDAIRSGIKREFEN